MCCCCVRNLNTFFCVCEKDAKQPLKPENLKISNVFVVSPGYSSTKQAVIAVCLQEIERI